MSKKPDKKSAGKGKKGKKGADGSSEIKLSEHPRGKHQVQLAKSWAGLAGCALAGYSSWHGGAPFVDSVLRALLWGVAAYILVWFCAVQVWRHIAIAEVRAAEKNWREKKAAAERQALEIAAQAQAERAAAMR